MKKIMLALFATAALAVPGAALAHGGHHATLAKLTGTGTSFAGSSATASGSIAMSAKLGTGTFSATLTNDTAKATTRTGDRGTLSCAPSTATLTLTGATASNTLTGTLTLATGGGTYRIQADAGSSLTPSNPTALTGAAIGRTSSTSTARS